MRAIDTIGRSAGGNAGDKTWKDCRTMHELVDMDRPSVTAWLRHLAGVPAQDPVPAMAAH